jgi:hypothetical protein
MKTAFSILLSIVMFSATTAFAQNEDAEIVTDRPDQSNTPLLLQKGALQIETGFVAEQDKTKTSRSINYTYNETLIKFGVNDLFELRFDVAYLGTRVITNEVVRNQGFSPIKVGVKIKLADQKGAWPQAAVISNIGLRTGSKEFTTPYNAGDITFAFAHDLTQRLSLTYNLGCQWTGDSPESVFTYTLSFAYAVTRHLSCFAESYSYFRQAQKADNRIDGGFTSKLAARVQYDVSAGLGLSENAPDYFVSTGLSIRLLK